MTTRGQNNSRSFSSGHTRLTAVFWLIFAAGVLIQVFAPRLKIEHNAFVIPSSMVAAGREFRPADIVGRERLMQVISALLTLGGALGLAVQYRQRLLRRNLPE